MAIEVGEQEGAAGTRRCPFCAEEIQAAAILCKHCRSAVPVPKPPEPVAEEPVQVQATPPPLPEPSAGFGSAVIFGLVVVGLLGGAVWAQSWYDRQKFLDAIAPLSRSEEAEADKREVDAKRMHAGERAVVRHPSGKKLPCFDTHNAYAESFLAWAAKNETEWQLAVLKSRLLVQETVVLALDDGDSVGGIHVRILDGPYLGNDCWIDETMLVKR